MASGVSGASSGRRGKDEDMLARAVLALDNEQPLDAERMAGEVLGADPRHAGALYVLGCALVMQGRAAEALAPLEAAAAGRDDPEFEIRLAGTLRQVGRHEDAVNRLELATRRHPAEASVFLELGYQLVLMDRYDEAVDALGLGLQIAPMMPQLSIQLGFAYLSRGDCANAKAALARALDISPHADDAVFGMAKAHQELGENEEAAGYFQRYLTNRPNDGGGWLSLGHCLLELGQLDAGYECFRRAASGDAERYGAALTSLASAARGRFWLRPRDAMRFLRASAFQTSASAPESADGTHPSPDRSHCAS
jgi:tetratricopeptide (TPR) repeat protein